MSVWKATFSWMTLLLQDLHQQTYLTPQGELHSHICQTVMNVRFMCPCVAGLSVSQKGMSQMAYSVCLYGYDKTVNLGC